jgi:DNA-binding transcriptional LysR family regulator
MNLSLRQLKVFLGVAQSSSFTKTAQRLHLSQAALSAIIRELETQLQCRLLDRTTRTVSLTEAGRTFLPTAAHIVETIENSALELGKIGRAEQRALRLGVTPHIAVSLIPEVLKTFSALCPSVHVDMSDRPPAELLGLVEAGELDAAFGAFFAKVSGIDRLPIFPTRLVIASSLAEGTSWPDFTKCEVTWRALQDLPLICLPKDNPIQRLIDENLAKEQVTPGKRIVVSHLDTAIAMAEAGFGVAIVPSISEATCQRFQVRLDPIQPAVEFAFYCIMRAGRGDSGIIDQFSEVFKEVVERFHQASASARSTRRGARKTAPKSAGKAAPEGR